MTIAKLSFYASLLAITIANALAADRLTYEDSVFRAARDAGKPILVHVTAPWCGECKAQKPIVAALADKPEYAALTIFDVDYDTQKSALRDLNIRKQSTLVVYRGKAEIARAVGITRREAIEALLRKAL